MKNIQTSSPRDRLIFALDIGGDPDEALSWVRRLKDHVGLFKVGKEAFTHFGPDLVRDIQKNGGRVFLDLKFHDIPNTVARAAEAAVKLGVAMFNVHAMGGMAMLKETAASVHALSAKNGQPPPLILAVTVLTSLNNKDLESLGFQETTDQLVVRLARMAQASGIPGVVASAQDVAAIRRACGRDFIIVTPGIRGTRSVAGDDQKRTLSPAEAIKEGADYIVVGRPIRTAENPEDEARQIVREIATGLSERHG
jgi:orotidine-5'-phosphate decarboxylase